VFSSGVQKNGRNADYPERQPERVIEKRYQGDAMSKGKKGILLESGTNEVEFLLFRLGGQYYGINVEKVTQIIIFDPAKVAPLPKQPPGVLGVLDYRGATINIIDLALHLELRTEDALPERRLLLVVEFNKRRTGFVVDLVERIERCSWKQFEAMSETSGTGVSCVVGTITLSDGIVVLLDVESILAAIDPTMGVDYFEKEIKKDESNSRSKISIVSCEDSALIQKLLLRSLGSAGYSNIRSFSTGADGYEYLCTVDPGSVDIVITDIEMPSMDGLTLCKNLRAMPEWKNVPIVFFSSMISDQMAAKCASVGGDAWFSKPEIHLLVEGVDEHVRRTRAAKDDGVR
jgi:two-component system, chemotaxis family, chemotaxis protein CheV